MGFETARVEASRRRIDAGLRDTCFSNRTAAYLDRVHNVNTKPL